MRGGQRRPAVQGYAVFSEKPCYGKRRNQQTVCDFKPCEASQLEYTYPLKLLVPEHASSSACSWVYPITFGGGLVEGDSVSLSLRVEDECAVMLTSQGYTKVYHCEEERETCQNFEFTVGHHALLAIVPDPIVCFKDAIYSQTQTVWMELDSNIILLDWITAGRVAVGELWQFKRCKCKNSIWYGDNILFRDHLNLRDRQDLSLLEAMQDYQIVGMLVLLGPCLETLTTSLKRKYGVRQAYGESPDSTTIISFSPLEYDMNSAKIKGCVLRIAAQDTSMAVEQVEAMLKPLFPVLGGNPFENKY